MKTNRKLTCLYIAPSIISFYAWPKMFEQRTLTKIIIEILILLIFKFGWQLGVVVVHAGLSAVSDCAMVRKVKVTNGMQELRTEEDSLELRQVGSR